MLTALLSLENVPAWQTDVQNHELLAKFAQNCVLFSNFISQCTDLSLNSDLHV